MNTFNSIREAFHFVVNDLIPLEHDYIVAIRGPEEIESCNHCTIQVVSQNMVFNDGEVGLTLHLPFDPSSRTFRELVEFVGTGLEEHCDEFRLSGNVPCFALRFEQDIELAVDVATFVLREVYGYADLDGFEIEVHDEGPISSAA